MATPVHALAMLLVDSSHVLHWPIHQQLQHTVSPTWGILNGSKETTPLLLSILNCNTLECILANYPFGTESHFTGPMMGNHATPAWALAVTRSFLLPKEALSYKALGRRLENSRFLRHVEYTKAIH